jgi:hypothetical protein
VDDEILSTGDLAFDLAHRLFGGFLLEDGGNVALKIVEFVNVLVNNLRRDDSLQERVGRRCVCEQINSSTQEDRQPPKA